MKAIAGGVYKQLRAGLDLIIVMKPKSVEAEFDVLQNQFLELAKKGSLIRGTETLSYTS